MASPLALASFWFLYMAGMGLVFPYQALYFRENVGLSGAELGVLLGMRPLMGMLFQGFWGHVADRTGSRTGVLAVVLLGNAAAYALFPAALSYTALLGAMCLASLFGTSFFPMATSVTMAALGERPTENFGRIRVWGTIGFLLLVVAFPPLLDAYQERRGLGRGEAGPSEPGLEMIFYVAAAFTLAAALVALRLPRSGSLGLRARRGDLGLLLRHRPFRRLLVFTFVAYFFLQGPILMFPLFVREHGGDIDTLSRLWIPMLMLEIPLVFLSGSTLSRFGARGLLAIGVVADGIRWSLCALADDLIWVYPLQLLHGVVVAGLVVGGPLYVEAAVPERLRSTGQGVMSMLGISFAAMLSSANAGFLIDRFGIDAPFAFGGAGALLLGISIPWLLPRPSRPDEAEGPATFATKEDEWTSG